jgi:IS5 family transposase
MHNLLANIAKFRQLLIEVYGSDNLINGNFRRYSNQPKASDIEIVALAFAAESMQIDSENMLYTILKSSYPQYCSTLPDRTNFNRRRRFLQPFIDLLSERLSNELSEGEDTFIIDSMPLPICRFVRCGKLKIMKDDLDFLPAKGYSAIDKTHYFGYKLNLVVSSNSVINNFSITQANVHDIRSLEDMTKGFLENVNLLGDKGYIGKNIQLSLFKEYAVNVITPMRNNQTGPAQWNPGHRKTRKRIETTFSQFCDQFSIKKNFAKSFFGYFARITSKIGAFTCLQYLNMLNQKPLNHIKHSLAC